MQLENRFAQWHEMLFNSSLLVCGRPIATPPCRINSRFEEIDLRLHVAHQLVEVSMVVVEPSTSARSLGSGLEIVNVGLSRANIFSQSPTLWLALFHALMARHQASMSSMRFCSLSSAAPPPRFAGVGTAAGVMAISEYNASFPGADHGCVSKVG